MVANRVCGLVGREYWAVRGREGEEGGGRQSTADGVRKGGRELRVGGGRERVMTGRKE